MTGAVTAGNLALGEQRAIALKEMRQLCSGSKSSAPDDGGKKWAVLGAATSGLLQSEIVALHQGSHVCRRDHSAAQLLRSTHVDTGRRGCLGRRLLRFRSYYMEYSVEPGMASNFWLPFVPQRVETFHDR
jgi:hypothetical protein